MPAPGSAVVIGAGLAGLSSAVLLAESGWQVTVLERHAIAGGMLQRFRRQRHWFDVGFHFATGGAPGSITRRLLARLGILSQIRFLDPDPEAQFVVGGQGMTAMRVPVGLAATEKAIIRRQPEQHAAIARFFALLRGRLAANAWLRMLVPDDAPCALTGEADQTVAECLHRCGVEGPAAVLLGAGCSILALQADNCPFDLYAAFAGSAYAGSWRIVGGGDGLTGPLVDRLTAHGGQLLLRRPAQRIVHDGRIATAVLDATGETHPADLVISTLHPDDLLTLAGPDAFRPGFRDRVATIPDSQGALIVSAALARSAHEMGRSHHLLRLPEGDDCYAVAADRWQQDLPPSLEIMCWLDTARTAAWRQSRLGRRPADYQAWKEREADRLLAGLDAHFPGLRAQVQRRWIASPLSFRHYTGGRHGGAMGLSHARGQLGTSPLLPRNKLRNLLLAGHSISHPGILGTIIGAMVIAGSVTGRDLRAEVADIVLPEA